MYSNNFALLGNGVCISMTETTNPHTTTFDRSAQVADAMQSEELSLQEKTRLVWFLCDNGFVPRAVLRQLRIDFGRYRREYCHPNTGSAFTEWVTTIVLDYIGNMGCEPMKWKALRVQRFGVGRGGGLGWRGATNGFKVVGSLKERKDRERSAAHIQYTSLSKPPVGPATPESVPPDRSDKSLFGKVEFFVTIENPLYMLDGEDSLSRAGHEGPPRRAPNISGPASETSASGVPDRGREDHRGPLVLILAFAINIPIEATSDGLLLRIKEPAALDQQGRRGLFNRPRTSISHAKRNNNEKDRCPIDGQTSHVDYDRNGCDVCRNSRTVETIFKGVEDRIVIDGRCVHSLIGLSLCDEKQYILWEDCCWTTAAMSLDFLDL